MAKDQNVSHTGNMKKWTGLGACDLQTSQSNRLWQQHQFLHTKQQTLSPQKHILVTQSRIVQ
jgi:hypothetical protein